MYMKPVGNYDCLISAGVLLKSPSSHWSGIVYSQVGPDWAGMSSTTILINYFRPENHNLLIGERTAGTGQVH